jgi:hypothetical protein
MALHFGSALLQSIHSTSQQKQQKRQRRQLPPFSDSIAKHSISQASRCGSNSSLTGDSYGQSLQQTVEASKKHCVSSSTSHVHSPNTFPVDRLCLVCDAHCFTSCVVCEQDFCSTHLYQCLECDNQYCSRCLDDHRADGYWGDSDAAAEQSRGWTKNSVSGLRVGSLHLSPLPTGRNVLVTKPCVSLRQAPSQGPNDARRSEISQPHTCGSKSSQPNAHRSENSHTRQTKTSPHNLLTALTSLLTFLLQSIRQGLSSSADRITVSLRSQSGILPEVSR